MFSSKLFKSATIAGAIEFAAIMSAAATIGGYIHVQVVAALLGFDPGPFFTVLDST